MEELFDYIQHELKTLRKLRIKQNVFKLAKDIDERPTASITLNYETLKYFSLKSEWDKNA